MRGSGTLDIIFILRQVPEKILEGNNRRYWNVVGGSWEGFWSSAKRSLESKVEGGLWKNDTRHQVRSGAGCMAGFKIRVWFHQGSCLSPLLFIIVMDAISETRREVWWDMLDTPLNRGCWWQRQMEKKNPCGWPFPEGIIHPEGERSLFSHNHISTVGRFSRFVTWMLPFEKWCMCENDFDPQLWLLLIYWPERTIGLVGLSNCEWIIQGY